MFVHGAIHLTRCKLYVIYIGLICWFKKYIYIYILLFFFSFVRFPVVIFNSSTRRGENGAELWHIGNPPVIHNDRVARILLPLLPTIVARIFARLSAQGKREKLAGNGLIAILRKVIGTRLPDHVPFSINRIHKPSLPIKTSFWDILKYSNQKSYDRLVSRSKEKEKRKEFLLAVVKMFRKNICNRRLCVHARRHRFHLAYGPTHVPRSTKYHRSDERESPL